MTLTLKIFQIIGVILMSAGVAAAVLGEVRVFPICFVLGMLFYAVGRMGIWLMDSGKPKVM